MLVFCQAKSNGLGLTAFPLLLRPDTSGCQRRKLWDKVYTRRFSNKIQRCQIQWVYR